MLPRARWAPSAPSLLLDALLHGRWQLAWRAWLILLGRRRPTPRAGSLLPFATQIVPELDTGGAYRPKHRMQDPSKDPDEPGGGESSSRGSDHGWANCTMSSGADLVAYATDGELTPWGGRLRHEQSDLDGGCDLGDLERACAELGVDIANWSGRGWSEVADAHGDRRPIVIQGEGNVPGSETFDGGHACCIGVETRSDGYWLFGDPLASDWQWVSPGSIRSWAERWQSSIAFVVGPKPPAEPEPEPKPPKPPVDTTPYDQAQLDAYAALAAAAAVVAAEDATVSDWLDWLRAGRPAPADRWDAGSWADDESLLYETADPCEPGAPASWARGRLPYPVADALLAERVLPIWDGAAWRQTSWLA